MDMKLEVVVLAVADVGRAKDFYDQLGWRLNAGTPGSQFPAPRDEHENRLGAADRDWRDWYAAYMVAEQAGTELPR